MKASQMRGGKGSSDLGNHEGLLMPSRHNRSTLHRAEQPSLFISLKWWPALDTGGKWLTDDAHKMLPRSPTCVQDPEDRAMCGFVLCAPTLCL